LDLFRISEYYERGAINNPADPETKKSSIADSGAFVAYSGAKSGRSPKDKRIVTDYVREK
jgi:ATP-dependent phosphoenolpyruvate carboxykinase